MSSQHAAKCIRFGDVLLDENQKLILLCRNCHRDCKDVNEFRDHIENCSSLDNLFKQDLVIVVNHAKAEKKFAENSSAGGAQEYIVYDINDIYKGEKKWNDTVKENCIFKKGMYYPVEADKTMNTNSSQLPENTVKRVETLTNRMPKAVTLNDGEPVMKRQKRFSELRYSENEKKSKEHVLNENMPTLRYRTKQILTRLQTMGLEVRRTNSKPLNTVETEANKTLELIKKLRSNGLNIKKVRVNAEPKTNIS